MNSELSSVLAYMEKERGLDREVLIQAVEFAMRSAAKKGVGPEAPLRVEIDRKTLDMKAFAERQIVEKVEKPALEISLAEARLIKPDAEIGQTVEVEATPRDFGRIAAQTAKQAILQKIREAERDIVFTEYKDRVGDIVTGSVRQFNRSDIIVDLGRAEAVVPAKERVPTEEYQVGDRIRGYIVAVQQNVAGPSVVLSRSHPNFVKALFQLEVTEITDGIVEIKGIAREAGYRTKVAVVSKDAKVDPVGACVGMRGIRVKNIVRELSGEKIDIIRWSDDVKTYVMNALSPAKLAKVWVDPDIPNTIHVVADAEQLSLAIGKRGQNVRLTAKLVGWRIDIQRDESSVTFAEKVTRAVEAMAAVEGIGREHAEALVKAGYLTVEGILAAEVSDLVEAAGFDQATATAVREAAEAAQAKAAPTQEASIQPELADPAQV
jgi:N utilization substance protein A